jgi:hypothetical protein
MTLGTFGVNVPAAENGDPNALTPLDPTATKQAATGSASTSEFKITAGWYVAIGCIGGIALANTPVGPLATGLLAIALLYQVTNLIEGN